MCGLGWSHLVSHLHSIAPLRVVYPRPNVPVSVPGDLRPILVTQLPALDPGTSHWAVSIIVGGFPRVWLLPSCVTISISNKV